MGLHVHVHILAFDIKDEFLDTGTASVFTSVKETCRSFLLELASFLKKVSYSATSLDFSVEG